MPHLSVIVPVFQAENCLYELWRRLKLSMEAITHDFEVLLIDDFSDDRSWQIILTITKSDHRVKGYKFSRNFGQHYGITAGLDYCSGDFAIVMDCDLQDQPEEIGKLYQKAKEGYDVVLARRANRQDSSIKRLFSWLFYKMFKFFIKFKYDGRVGNFRIISKKVILTFRLMRENARFFGAMVSWMGFKTATVEVQHAKYYKHKSTYTFQKLLRLASDSIIAYSDMPLRLALLLGFVMTCAAVSYGSYHLIMSYIYHTSLSGFTRIMVALHFIGGMIIWILGIIGIYLNKTFEEAKKRPLYIIEETTFDR